MLKPLPVGALLVLAVIIAGCAVSDDVGDRVAGSSVGSLGSPATELSDERLRQIEEKIDSLFPENQIDVTARWLVPTERSTLLEVTWSGPSPTQTPAFELIVVLHSPPDGLRDLGLIMLPENVEVLEEKANTTKWQLSFPRVAQARYIALRVMSLRPLGLWKIGFDTAPDI